MSSTALAERLSSIALFVVVESVSRFLFRRSFTTGSVLREGAGRFLGEVRGQLNFVGKISLRLFKDIFPPKHFSISHSSKWSEHTFVLSFKLKFLPGSLLILGSQTFLSDASFGKLKKASFSPLGPVVPF